MAPEAEGFAEMHRLQKHFTINLDCQESFRFLGINRVTQNNSTVDHMLPYIDIILKEYKTCLDLQGPLRVYSVPSSKESCNTTGCDEESDLLKHNPRYNPQSFIASLLFLCRCTRPDLSFAVSFMGQTVKRWTKLHDRCLKQTMGYLQATRDLVLLLPPEGVLNDGYNRVFVIFRC